MSNNNSERGRCNEEYRYSLYIPRGSINVHDYARGYFQTMMMPENPPTPYLNGSFAIVTKKGPLQFEEFEEWRFDEPPDDEITDDDYLPEIIPRQSSNPNAEHMFVAYHYVSQTSDSMECYDFVSRSFVRGYLKGLEGKNIPSDRKIIAFTRMNSDRVLTLKELKEV